MAAVSVFRSFTVILILSTFVCATLCFGIPSDFSAVRRAVPYQDAAVHLVQDGHKTCSSGGESGICYNPLNCLRVSGIFGNNCPGSDGVCCLFYRQCGQGSSQEVSYFQGTDEEAGSGCNYRVVSYFQGTDEEVGCGCNYRVVKRSERHCRMRVKLEQLELPVDCRTSVHIEGIQKGKSIGRLRFPERNSIDVICSTEAGNEYAFDIHNIDEVHLNVESSDGNSGRWKIKITQVHCRDDDDVDDASEYNSGYIPAVWPPPLATHHPTHTPSTRPTTARPGTQPTSRPVVTMDYSICGVKGPDSGVNLRANDNILDGDSKPFIPFIQDLTSGNPPRNDSDHVKTLQKLIEKGRKNIHPMDYPSRVNFYFPSGLQEYPWQVAMKVRGRFLCSASIISDQYILTAAHCVSKYRNSPQTLFLTLGDYDLSSSNEQSSYVPEIEHITVHPAYSQITLRNDLAVLKLKKKIIFAINIRPICLATPETEGKGYSGRWISGVNITDEIAFVTGWQKGENNKLQSKLNVMSSHVESNIYCATQWEKNGAPRGLITKDMMCTTPIGSAGYSCIVDSGGPSVIQFGNTYYQVGIASFQTGSCVDETLPDIHTRVTAYTDWILQQMN